MSIDILTAHEAGCIVYNGGMVNVSVKGEIYSDYVRINKGKIEVGGQVLRDSADYVFSKDEYGREHTESEFVDIVKQADLFLNEYSFRIKTYDESTYYKWQISLMRGDTFIAYRFPSRWSWGFSCEIMTCDALPIVKMCDAFDEKIFSRGVERRFHSRPRS